VNSALAVLPLPELKNPLRDALILRERINGATQIEAATAAQCSRRTAQRVEAEHGDYLQAQKERGARTFLAQIDAIVPALAATATDPENRNQVNAFVALSEKLCDWGGKGGITLNTGDTYAVTNVVDLSTHGAMSDEQRQRRAELLERYGMDG